MGRYVLLLAAMLFVSGVLAGCSNHKAATAQSWFTGRPPAEPATQWQPVSADDVFQVTPRNVDRAIAILEEAPVRELSPEQASALVDKPLPEGAFRYCLIRSVYLHDNIDGFTVYSSPSAVFVEHADLGGSASWMQRQPLVVRLQKVPKELYVHCLMAQ